MKHTLILVVLLHLVLGVNAQTSINEFKKAYSRFSTLAKKELTKYVSGDSVDIKNNYFHNHFSKNNKLRNHIYKQILPYTITSNLERYKDVFIIEFYDNEYSHSDMIYVILVNDSVAKSPRYYIAIKEIWISENEIFSIRNIRLSKNDPRQIKAKYFRLIQFLFNDKSSSKTSSDEALFLYSFKQDRVRILSKEEFSNLIDD